MSGDLDRIITELEKVTSLMLDTACWRQVGEFGELSSSRHELASLLMHQKDLDMGAAERIDAVIQAGHGLVARAIAMRDSLLIEIAQTEAQQSFTREWSNTMAGGAQAHRVDLKA